VATVEADRFGGHEAGIQAVHEAEVEAEGLGRRSRGQASRRGTYVGLIRLAVSVKRLNESLRLDLQTSL